MNKYFIITILSSLLTLVILASVISSDYTRTHSRDSSTPTVEPTAVVTFKPVATATPSPTPKPTPTPVPTPTPYTLTTKEIELIALVTMAEAEGESELGKRLVIDTILNRVDTKNRWPNTVEGVIYQPHQFSSMWNGRVNRCYVREDICQLVREELISRTNYEVVYFQMYNYPKYGKPLFKEGCHYFATIK